MRFSIIIFLVGTLLFNIMCTNFPITSISNTSGASLATSTPTAWESLVQAYSNVKRAESEGAPHNDIVRLSTELDLSLDYYANSTIYTQENQTALADQYATLSIDQSSNVSSEANALYATAKTQTLQRQELTYAVAVFAALLSSSLIIEKDRIENYLRKKNVIPRKEHRRAS